MKKINIISGLLLVAGLVVNLSASADGEELSLAQQLPKSVLVNTKNADRFDKRCDYIVEARLARVGASTVTQLTKAHSVSGGRLVFNVEVDIDLHYGGESSYAVDHIRPYDYIVAAENKSRAFYAGLPEGGIEGVQQISGSNLKIFEYCKQSSALIVK